MAGLRMFSYLPNPRLWKATIAARFCGVEVEVRGASPKALRDWLWDYDARPLAEQERRSLSSLARTGRVGLTSAKLFKTEAFLEAQSFGNVPAAFGRDAAPIRGLLQERSAQCHSAWAASLPDFCGGWATRRLISLVAPCSSGDHP